jgi:hypothetical protein
MSKQDKILAKVRALAEEMVMVGRADYGNEISELLGDVGQDFLNILNGETT